MKTVLELTNSFNKANKDHFTISEKQYKWLLDLAKKEDIVLRGGYDRYFIYLQDNRILIIKEKKIPYSAVGGFIGSKSAGCYEVSINLCLKTIEGSVFITSPTVRAHYNKYAEVQEKDLPIIYAKEFHNKIAY